MDKSAFIADLRGNPAPLYRDLWGTARSFDDLPCLTFADLARSNLRERRYANEQSLEKLVRSDRGAFLSEWSYSSIREGGWGHASRRPMVFFTDSYDTIEKAMWCYLNGMVPLAAEMDHDFAVYAAKKYEVDSIITDPEALEKLEKYLSQRNRLSHLTIVTSDPDAPQKLAKFNTYTRDNTVLLAFPETGAFARGALGKKEYALLPGIELQSAKDSIILTTWKKLVTPLIKYKINWKHEPLTIV